MSKQQGNITVRALWLLVIILAITVAILAIGKIYQSSSPETRQKDASDISNSSQVEVNKRLSESLQRKNDAQTVAAAITEYSHNNNGTLPTAWEAGQIVGPTDATPSNAELKIYKSVAFSRGQQSALRGSSLRVVFKATCNEDASTAASSSITGFAVQYTTIEEDGSLKSECLEG